MKIRKTAEQLKNEGQQKVIRQAWMEKALDCLYRLACKAKRLSANELRSDVIKQAGLPHHPGAWGPLFTGAARAGWIRKTGQITKGKHSASRAHTCHVWESRVA